MQIDRKLKIEICENAFTYIVVFAMFAYGIGKMVQFNGTMHLDKRVAEMTGMELMWSFYSYSKPFVYTLGILEVVGGILMLCKRTRLFGCLFVSTMLINIILQDIFYGVNIGALKAAIIYQVLIIIILWFNKDRVKQAFKILTNFDKVSTSKRESFTKTILAMLLFIVLRIVEYYVTIKW